MQIKMNTVNFECSSKKGILDDDHCGDSENDFPNSEVIRNSEEKFLEFLTPGC